MKKFIIECIFGILFIALSGLLLYHSYPNSGLAKKVSDIDSKIDILNLGTSHGNDFDYSNVNLVGLNMNREGNTLFYDLQNYLFLRKKNFLTKKAIVIIPISYFVFGLDENRTDRKPDNSFVNQFYYYLPKEQIFSFSKQKKNSLIIERIQSNTKKIFYNKKEKTGTNLTLIEETVKRVQHHKKLSNYSSKEKNFNYLDTLISEILKDGNTPILVTTPYHYSYNDQFGKKWLNLNYYNFVKKFSIKYNLTYLDYSYDKRISLDETFFKDSDHLNNKGRNIFNTIFFKDIETLIKKREKTYKENQAKQH